MEKPIKNKKRTIAPGLVLILVPAVFYVLLDKVYTLSLHSTLALVIYTVCALVSLEFTLLLTKKKNSGKLLGAFTVFLLTYLSVYPIAVHLNLNLPFFDFIKGLNFTLICFGACYTALVFINHVKRFISSAAAFVLHALVIFVSVLLPFVFTGYFIANNSMISSDIILALAQTNAHEGLEFFLSNCNYRWALSLICLIFVYSFNYRALSFVKTRVKSKEQRTLCQAAKDRYIRQRQKALDKFMLLSSLMATLLVFVFLALPRLDYLPFSVIKVTQSQLDNFRIYKDQKANRLSALKELKTLTVRRSDEKNSQLSDKKGSLFVLVIGESESTSNMHAYGYKRPNTPMLERDMLNHNNILFTHAFSCWPQTVQALSYALTENSQYEPENISRAVSIMEAAKGAGFKTYWLSNQRKFGVYETPVTVISSTADVEIFTNGSAKMESAYYDEELLKRIPEFDENEDCFAVIHLMGSHQRYTNRLPSNYFVYKGTDEAVDNYDNTILYTDYILSSIYRKMSSYRNFKAMLYFSDHGEDPHVVGGHDPVNVNLNMLHVPMAAYFSDSFVRDRSRTYKNLLLNQDKYFSNDLIFNTMTDIMGIEGLPGVKEEYSLCSDKYHIDQHTLKLMYGKSHIKGNSLVNN